MNQPPNNLNPRGRFLRIQAALLVIALINGCVSGPEVRRWSRTAFAAPPTSHQTIGPEPVIQLASLEEGGDSSVVNLMQPVPDVQSAAKRTDSISDPAPPIEVLDAEAAVADPERLAAFESAALASHPGLQKLREDYEALRARTGYVDRLPDPKLTANWFLSPIETAAGAQRANMSISQAIPWLERLDAARQRACFEALAAAQALRAEELRILADVRTVWSDLYVVQRQQEILGANQSLLEDLLQVANARVATGSAAQGDVLSGTLEYSRLEEQQLELGRRLVTLQARLNRMTSGAAGVEPVAVRRLDVSRPVWRAEVLMETAWRHQPALEASRLKIQAARWGIEVARLQQRPDFSLNASWFEIDSNRPTPGIVDIGRDAWSIGASVSLPIRDRKYRAIERESLRNHASARSSMEDLRLDVEARVRSLLGDLRSAAETVALYEDSILPQARDTLEADQQAYATNTVEFDRVIRDVRNLLTLEIGYHQALGRMATARAHLEQTVGVPLPPPAVSEPPPIPTEE